MVAEISHFWCTKGLLNNVQNWYNIFSIRFNIILIRNWVNILNLKQVFQTKSYIQWYNDLPITFIYEKNLIFLFSFCGFQISVSTENFYNLIVWICINLKIPSMHQKMQYLSYHLVLRKVSPLFFLLKYTGRKPSSHYFI